MRAIAHHMGNRNRDVAGATKVASTGARKLRLTRAFSGREWALVILYLLSAYCATYLLLPRLPLIADVRVYVLQPLIWSSLAGLCIWLWRRERRSAAFPVSRVVVVAAVLVGLFQIALLVLAGTLMGFGKSPYAHQAHVIPLNILFVGTLLGGQEVARWYLLVSLGRRHSLAGLAIAWALLCLVAVPVIRLQGLTSVQAAFPVLGQTLLPTASEGILATYLALVGGPLGSMAYRGTLMAFEWLSPILPSLQWALNAFLGVLAPALGLLIVRDLIAWRTEKSDEVQKHSRGMGWVLLASIAVFLLWFNMGIFGIRPDLIAGASMEPTMKEGDIAISLEVPAREVQVGDVVRYRQGSVFILHRVVEIDRDGGRYFFTTRGDNNNALDAPVDESRLEGKVVARVPKVGWPVLALKRLLFRLLG